VSGTIQFDYDGRNDIVVATPRWHIRTREDCEIWYHQWVDYLATFGRRVDCVMVLDDFHVEPEIATVWGEYRARINNQYTRLSYRVHSDWAVRLFAATSGVRYNAPSDAAPSVEAAVEAILRARGSEP